jgi:hypothetical protein
MSQLKAVDVFSEFDKDADLRQEAISLAGCVLSLYNQGGQVPGLLVRAVESLIAAAELTPDDVDRLLSEINAQRLKDSEVKP